MGFTATAALPKLEESATSREDPPFWKAIRVSSALPAAHVPVPRGNYGRQQPFQDMDFLLTMRELPPI